jgi:hypothetical protein
MALATVTPSEVDSKNEYSKNSRFGQKERNSNGEKKSKAPLFRERVPSKVTEKGGTGCGYEKYGQRKTNLW